MEQELTNGQIFVQTYKDDILKLSKYIPWLMQKSGSDVASEYRGEFGESQMKFPVYDATLMNFVKDARETILMDKNYSYAYTKRRIQSNADEEAAIRNAGLNDVDFLRGVITKYVTEGMRKSGRWQEAVERKLFLNVILKLKELAEFYEGPLER